jgi:peptide/nickel transport system substrate-binding protein
MKTQEAANFYYFAMNTKNPPFDKKEVRQAIAFAVDKESICKNVLFGVSSPIDLPWPKFSFAYDSKYEGMYTYNLDEAKKRLAAAGYPNGISFTIPSNNAAPETLQMGQLIQASLAKIGCTVNLNPMDTAQYNTMVQAGTFQANISIAGGTQWFPTRIAASSLYRFVNNTCWPNGTPPKAWMDGLNAADAELDPAKQKEAIKPAVACFMDEMWSLPIAFRFTLYGLQKGINGFGYGVFDQPRLESVTKS